MIGVDEDWPGGDDGLEGRFLSADTARLCVDTVEADDGLVEFGEELHMVPDTADGEGDLYLELTSLVRARPLAAFLLSAGTDAGVLLVSAVDSFFNARFNSRTSIQTVQIKPH